MNVCSIRGCELEAEEGLEMRAELGGGRNGDGPGRPPGGLVIIDSLELNVPVCRPHWSYLSQGSFRGISLDPASSDRGRDG